MATEAESYNWAEIKAGRLGEQHVTLLTRIAQTHYGLPVDGKCGPDTRAALEGQPVHITAPTPTPTIPTYTPEDWRAYLAHYLTGHELDFAVAWVKEESGGNPCAIGTPGATGPDGCPREMGIAQFYNPDDCVRLKLPGHELRAYCTGAQKISRALTPAEMDQQAKGTADLIAACKRMAQVDLDKLGVGWTGRDFYCLVKLQHGLPGISHSGLPAATKVLGHPPLDWTQFKAGLGLAALDHETERYRAEFPHILKNAEDTASVVP